MDIASLIKRARENDEALSSSKNKNKNIKNKKRKHQDTVKEEDNEPDESESQTPKIECNIKYYLCHLNIDINAIKIIFIF